MHVNKEIYYEPNTKTINLLKVALNLLVWFIMILLLKIFELKIKKINVEIITDNTTT